MSNEIGLNKESSQGASSVVAPAAPADNASTCPTQGKGWLKGGLAMVICCAAPLILLGGIALFGISLGALASGFLTLAALLACPIGMYLMMRLMNKKGEN